jgi:ubiquinone/menaquinone biosynthesis C-methylase UbiE
MMPGGERDNERTIRDAYERGDLYHPSRICRTVHHHGGDYADQLLAERIALARHYYRDGRLVDLCCATGAHLVEVARGRDANAIGVDLSERYLAAARELAAAQQLGGVRFVQADARALPLAEQSVGCLFCFSALYAIPNAGAVVREIGRVLKRGGYAVLDFGNRRSLNVFCLTYYPEWPPIQPLTLREIRQSIQAAGLEVVEHRRFQLLPLWAGKPSWLRPLLHPGWKSLMKRRLLGKMLDEWVSSLPLLRAFAFRHVVVCRKT